MISFKGIDKPDNGDVEPDSENEVGNPDARDNFEVSESSEKGIPENIEDETPGGPGPRPDLEADGNNLESTEKLTGDLEPEYQDLESVDKEVSEEFPDDLNIVDEDLENAKDDFETADKDLETTNEDNNDLSRPANRRARRPAERPSRRDEQTERQNE